MSKKKTIILSLVIFLYTIIFCIKLLQLGISALQIYFNDYKKLNSSIINNYQDEIKEGLKNADIIIPEQAQIKSIVYHIVWNDDTFWIQYEEKGEKENIKVVKSATKMPKLIIDNLEKTDKQEIINNVIKNIVGTIILLITPIFLCIIYYINNKRNKSNVDDL